MVSRSGSKQLINNRFFLPFVVLAAGLAMALAAQQKEVLAMARTDLRLGWEWRAGRVLAQRAAIRILTVKKEGGGFLGIARSPSLAGALPDPMVLTATVVAVDRTGLASVGKTMSLRIPRMELKGVAVDDLAAVGIIGSTAVCLVAAPQSINETGVAAWLPDAACD